MTRTAHLREPSMAGVWAKLDRASEHADLIAGAAAAWEVRNNPHNVAVVKSDAGNLITVSLLVGEWPDSHLFGPILGDWLHNLRSALEYLIFELWLANGQDPKRRSAFPVCREEKDWERAIAKGGAISGLTTEAQGVVESLQPTGALHGLAMLAALSNHDKHRELKPVLGSIVGGTGPAWSGGSGAPVIRHSHFIDKESQTIMEIEVNGALIDRPHGQVDLSLALRSDGPGSEHLLQPMMDHIDDYVRTVVSALEPLVVAQ